MTKFSHIRCHHWALKQVRLDINEAKRATSCSKACFVTYSLTEVWSVVCACKSCPSAERPDLTVTLLVHNGKDPPEPVLIIARPLRNTEAPNLRIANKKFFRWKKGNLFFWSCCSDNDSICYNINTGSTKFVTLCTFTLMPIDHQISHGLSSSKKIPNPNPPNWSIPSDLSFS